MQVHSTSGLIVTRAALSALVVATLAGAAMGQNALGDGRALDRNLQVGSGGYNTPVRNLQSQIKYNNAVVTGQAAGGKSFRGDIGYRATDEFGASLGSDTNYTFRRDAAYSAAPLMGIRSSDAIRYQFALSTGSALPTQFAGAAGAVPRYSSVSRGADVDSRLAPGAQRPGVGRVDSTGYGGDGTMRSTSQFTSQRAIRPSVVGFSQDDAGGQYTITASPLLGVNSFKIGQEERPDRASDQPVLPTIPGQVIEETETKGPNSRPVVNPLSGFEAGSGRTPSALDAFGTGNVPMADNALRSSAVGPGNVDHQRVLDRFETSYREQGGEVGAEPEAGAVEGTGEPGAAGAARPNAVQSTGLTWEQQLVRTRAQLRGEDPVEAIKKFEKDRLEAANRAVAGGRAAPTAGGGSAASAVDEAALKREMEAMNKAGSKLGLPPETLKALRAAGVNFERLDGGLLPARARMVDEASYRRSMASGQEMLAAERFFDAEESFTRAVAASPGDVMAAIGRIHAQLGGGLYLSAAANLRRVLIDHPEMAASTFGPELIPKPDRATKIRAQLLDVLEARRDRGNALGRDAGLLLGYLGHVTGDEQMARRGLDEFQRRLTAEEVTDAALVELLRGLWLTAGAPAAK